MEFHLTPELEEFVKNEVQSGRYHSTSEVVADALGLLAEHAKVRAAQIAALNEELERRIAEADAGELLDPAEVRAHMERRSTDRRRLQA